MTLHTYIKLSDGTLVAYSELLPDGSALVNVSRPSAGALDSMWFSLPSCAVFDIAGFGQAEVDSLTELVRNNATLILNLAKEGAAASATAGTPGAAGTTGARAAGTAGTTGAQTAGQHAQGTGAQKAGGAAGHAQGKTPGNDVPLDPAQEYQQTASAVLDAAGLVARFVPGTRVGRMVNMAMPAARAAVAAAPQIAEKAAPTVTRMAESAPMVAEKAARGLGKFSDMLRGAATRAASNVADAAKQAVEEYKRERDS